ncbi:MAG: ImmA/IrrE family metallo-endopeptidase [Chloroflexi bacterium]|nr:ImmA/IrrE family metallo-endopeptidase [Chloroflexota bacterium]
MAIDDAVIGARLQAARRALDLTQGEVGKKMGMVTSTISAIESGKRSVTGPELHAFAQLYHRPLAYFFEEEIPGSPGFEYLFRAADVETIDRTSIVEFQELTRDYALLEAVMDVPPLPLPSDYSQFGFRTDEDAETLAEMERGRLGLGHAPLKDLMDFLDSTVGIRTFLVPVAQSTWSGLLVRDESGRPCIAVNAKEESYRRNFDLAHEYGHVLAHLAKQGTPAARIDKVAEFVRSSADERFADAFASAFLMPRRAVLTQVERVLGANAGHFTDFDLVHLAMQFGVSGQAMSHRLVSLRKLSRQRHEEYWKGRRTFKDLAEALGYTVDWSPKLVLPARYRYLALKAYEEARISLAKLAELLRENYFDLRQRLRVSSDGPTQAGMAR